MVFVVCKTVEYNLRYFRKLQHWSRIFSNNYLCINCGTPTPVQAIVRCMQNVQHVIFTCLVNSFTYEDGSSVKMIQKNRGKRRY